MAVASLDKETSENVLRQVEFYFSDSNLPRDKFLTDSINESDDGLVSLALICSFTRMRNHLGLGSVKPEEVSEDTVLAVAEVLKQSSSLKLSDDGKKVGRTTTLLKPEEVIEQADSRTIAASPLEYTIRLDEVESFFSQYAKVNSVRLPRHVADKRCFCGTALVEFSTEEDAKNIICQQLVYGGAELELKPKKTFDNERENLMKEIEMTRTSQDFNNKKDFHMNESYPKGLIVAFTLKNLSSDTAEDNGTIQDTGNNVGGNQMCPSSADNVDSTANDSSDGESKDSEVKISGKVNEDVTAIENKKNGVEGEAGDIAAPSTLKDEVVTREDLKHVFQKFGTVKFIDYRMGEESGYIRFEKPEAGQKARAAAVFADEGGLNVKGHLVTLEPVTGDAEKQYWSLLRGNQERHRESKNGRGRGGRQNNRGGRRYDGKQNRDRGNDFAKERSHKAQKVGPA